MFELIFEALLRLLAEILGQVLMQMGFDAIVNHIKGEEKLLKGEKKLDTKSGIRIFGIIFFASIVGFVSLSIFPYHLFKPLLFPGISLILSPLIVGLIMHRIGQWREENKKKSTVLTTFWGGASFAFIVALIRFMFFI